MKMPQPGAKRRVVVYMAERHQVKRFLLTWMTVISVLLGTHSAAHAGQRAEDPNALAADLAYSIFRVEGYEQQLIRENESRDLAEDFLTWDNERKENNNWNYFTGFVIDGLLEAGSGEGRRLAAHYYDEMVSADGEISRYLEGVTDSAEPAKGLFHFLEDPKRSAVYAKAIRFVFSELQKQKQYPEYGYNFLMAQDEHGNPRHPALDYQFLLDTLYMTQPFLAECAKAVDEGLLTLEEEPGVPVSTRKIREDVTKRYVWIFDNMYDPETGLVQHGWKAEEKRGNGHFWGRSMGWLSMSLVDVIEMMPDGDDQDTLCGFLVRVLDGMLRWQDEGTGLWYNVLTSDMQMEGNRLEASVSAMMSYSLMKAWLLGIVTDLRYRDAGIRAFIGIAEYKLFGEEGSYFLQDTYLKSGAGETDDYYVRVPYVTDEGKGVGALLFSLPYAKRLFMEVYNER